MDNVSIMIYFDIMISLYFKFTIWLFKAINLNFGNFIILSLKWAGSVAVSKFIFKMNFSKFSWHAYPRFALFC